MHAKNVKRFRDFIFNPPITVGFLSSPFMSGGGGWEEEIVYTFANLHTHFCFFIIDDYFVVIRYVR